jgi:hypothetical protein
VYCAEFPASSKVTIEVSDSGSALICPGAPLMGDGGTAEITVNNEAFACIGDLHSGSSVGKGGSVRLANGWLAVHGSYTASQIVSYLHLKVYNGKAWVDASDKDVTATYFPIGTSAWSQLPLYGDEYSKDYDLTCYTLVHGGKTCIEGPSWSDADKKSGDWYHSDWYGWVSAENVGDGWIYHVDHGWQYVSDLGGNNGIVFWDVATKCWWFTGKAFYPYLYNYTKGKWYYYAGGTAPKRWFYDYDADAYVKESEAF